MSGRTCRAFVAAASLLLAGGALAAPRITVGPIQGDRKAAISSQLATSLCTRFDCVLWPRVSSGGEPDLAKARRAQVEGILVGAVEKKGSARTAAISLLAGSETPARTWRIPLTKGGLLPASGLKQIRQELGPALRRPAAPVAAAPVAPVAPPPAVAPSAPAQPPAAAPSAAAPPPTPKPRPPVAAAPAPVTPAPSTPAPRPAAAPARPAAAPAAEPALERWSWALELGVLAASREVTYGGLSAMDGTLRGFKATSFVAPLLRLELQPFHADPGLWGGTGFFAEYARSLFLKTEAPSGEKRTTTYQRAQLGLFWRAPPLTAWRIVLEPSLSGQYYAFAVSPSIDGLPDASLLGARLGLDLEIPVVWRISVVAGAGYTRWFTAKNLIKGSPRFFPSGSASALELEGGLGLALSGTWSLRVQAQSHSIGYSLDGDPTGTYAASDATDGILGVRAVLRGEF